MRKLFINAGAVALSVLAPLSAQADSGWYAGGNFGLSRNNFNSNDIFSAPALCVTVASYTCQKDSSGGVVEVFVGKELRDGFSIEAGLVYIENSAGADYQQPLSTGTLRQSTTALKFSAIKSVSLGSKGVLGFGKLGAALWSSRAAYDRTPNSVTFYDRSVTQTGISPVLGLGIEIPSGNKTGFRLGWDHYFGMGKEESFFKVGPNAVTTTKADVDVLYAGFSVKF